MQRRRFLQTLLAGAGGVAVTGRVAHAALPKMKITRVRYYFPGKETRAGVPNLTSTTNVICIDTDAGITGIGEGGTKDTLEHCASALIGQDPFRIETLWQNMFRGAFYPSGLEKLHALGGLDIALWEKPWACRFMHSWGALHATCASVTAAVARERPPSVKRPAQAWKPASRPSGPR